jgi:hypothetical protein
MSTTISEQVVGVSRCIARASSIVLMMLGITFIGEAGAQPAGNLPQGAPPPAVSGSSDFRVDAKHLLVPLPPPTRDELKANPPVADPHNMEGTWLAEGALQVPNVFSLPQTNYTKKGQQLVNEQMQREREADAQGKIALTDSGRCRPGNGIGIGADLFPAEVIQGKDKIVVLSEEGRRRWVIHMNRAHREDIKDAYFGDSVGHWEGDTLVVDTIGLRGTSSLIGRYSDKARIVSRLRKTDGGQKLELTTTTYDSETYTQPAEGRKAISYWHPGVQMLEFQCEENMEGAREGMTG